MTKYIIERKYDNARTIDEYDSQTAAAIALIKWCQSTGERVRDYKIEQVSS